MNGVSVDSLADSSFVAVTCVSALSSVALGVAGWRDLGPEREERAFGARPDPPLAPLTSGSIGVIASCSGGAAGAVPLVAGRDLGAAVLRARRDAGAGASVVVVAAAVADVSASPGAAPPSLGGVLVPLLVGLPAAALRERVAGGLADASVVASR